MATRTWASTGSTDMNNGDNYSPAGAIQATDDLVFDGSLSVVNAIITANLSVNSVTVTTGHTGTWSIFNKNLTISASSSIAGGGTRNLGNGVANSITLNGNSITLTIANATMASDKCSIISNGTSNSFVENRTNYPTYFSIVINDNCDLVASFSSETSLVGTGIELSVGNNSTFTSNGTNLVFYPVASDFLSFGSNYVWNGNSTNSFFGNASAVYFNIPAIVYTGTGTYFTFSNNGFKYLVNYILTGNVDLGASILRIVERFGSAYTINFDFGGYNLACKNYAAGSGTTGNVNVLFRNGIFNITSFLNTYNAGTTVQNFGSSIWTASGNWSYSSNHTIIPDSSTIKFTNTATITPAGKRFGNIIINAPSKTIALAANLTCHQLLNQAGTLNKAGYKLIEEFSPVM